MKKSLQKSVHAGRRPKNLSGWERCISATRTRNRAGFFYLPLPFSCFDLLAGVESVTLKSKILEPFHRTPCMRFFLGSHFAALLQPSPILIPIQNKSEGKQFFCGNVKFFPFTRKAVSAVLFNFTPYFAFLFYPHIFFNDCKA